MTRKEQADYYKLNRLWAIGKATRAQMLRALALQRKDNKARRTP